MRFTNFIIAGLASLALAGCATMPPMPNQSPKADIHNKTKSEVADRIAGLCQEYGLTVGDIKDSSVACSMRADTMSQIFYHTKYGSDVEDQIRFLILSPQPKLIRVTVQSNLAAQNAFGGVRTYGAQPQENADVLSILHDLNDWSHTQ